MVKPLVVKLAQPGIDVKTAGDENLVYNSNWPLLKIVASGSFSTTDFQTRQIVATHNLGYVPFFTYYANTSMLDWSGTAMQTEDRSEFLGPTGITPVIDEKYLYFNGVSGAAYTGKIKFTYYIFALDITTAYTAPSIKSGGVIGPRNRQTVFKLAKPHKDISSKNLEDYIVNSLARSPLIHSVFPGKTGPNGSAAGYGFIVNHNLGYIPMFFAFAPVNDSSFPPNSWEPLFISSIGTSGFTIDSQKLNYNDFNNNAQVSIVILKDPFNVSYTIGVTI